MPTRNISRQRQTHAVYAAPEIFAVKAGPPACGPASSRRANPLRNIVLQAVKGCELLVSLALAYGALALATVKVKWAENMSLALSKNKEKCKKKEKKLGGNKINTNCPHLLLRLYQVLRTSCEKARTQTVYYIVRECVGMWCGDSPRFNVKTRILPPTYHGSIVVGEACGVCVGLCFM